jgi:micrococcal nuclease
VAVFLQPCHLLVLFVRCLDMDTHTASCLIFSLPFKRWLALGLATCLLCAAPTSFAATKRANTGRIVTGVVTHVTDGDTLWLQTSSSTEAIKVRFSGIDAPESCQDWGAQATTALKAKVLHQTVVLRTRTRDDYGRLVASVRLGGDDVGAWLVHSGYAWSYHSSRGDGPYAAEEHAARNARRGLWAAGGAIEPKLFRKSHGSCKH